MQARILLDLRNNGPFSIFGDYGIRGMSVLYVVALR